MLESLFCCEKTLSSDGGSSAEDYSSKLSKLTRAASHLPTTIQKGVLGSQCTFCAKTRKRKKYNSSETLYQCMTIECSKEIIASAQRAGDSKILVIGEDLIAKEARYHHSCRRNYLRDHRKQGIEPDNQMSKKNCHDIAFSKLSSFIEKVIVLEKCPKSASVVFSMYKEDYVTAGGVEEDIQTYKLQNLLNKIKTKFASISADKQSDKSGSFLFSAEISSAEAKAKLIESDQKQESIRSAA